MLHFICLNSAIDFAIEVTSFTYGEVIRSISSKTFASGKSVNSAFSADLLGTPFRLHCICGELDFDFYNKLTFKSGTVSLFAVPGETRRNITIRQKGDLVCHIQNSGYVISPGTFHKFLGNVLSAICDDDLVVISGSVPKGIGKSDLIRFLSEIRGKGATVVMDSELSIIGEMPAGSVRFIKPNLQELVRGLDGKRDYVYVDEYLRSLLSRGIQAIIITLGGDGALVVMKNGCAIRAYSSYDKLASFEAVGSGDAFIGAFSAGISKEFNLKDAIRDGIAAGHANLFLDGPGRIGDEFWDVRDRTTCEEVQWADLLTLLCQKVSPRA